MRGHLDTPRTLRPLLSGLAALALGVLLLVPASATARFSELSQFTGFNCPGPLAFDAGSATRASTLYVTDPCLNQSQKGAYSEVFARAPNGSAQSSFNAGTLENFDYENTLECFNWLGGVAVDPASGDLYLSDQASGVNAVFDFADSNPTVDRAQTGSPDSGQQCNGNGPLEAALESALHPGTDIFNSPGSIAEPQGLAIYAGNLYIAGGGAVVSTPLGSSLGSPVNSFALTPADSDPIALAIDPDTGAMFVLDDGPHKGVYEYSATSGGYVGVFVTGFGTGTFSNPTAVALDPLAHVVYVADAGSGTVDTFSEETGASLLQTPVLSNEYPYGVALDTTNDVLYVADEEGQGPNTSGGLVERFSYTPAPSCSTLSAATKGGVATSLSLSCTDAAGASLTYAIAAEPAHGTLSGFNPSTGAVTYTPTPGYEGSDTFTYTASSVDGTSAPTSVTVSVTGPTCSPETLTTGYQAAATITLACTDSASTISRYTIIAPPSHGSLTTPTAGGTLTYTPTNIFEGTDGFTFEAINAKGQASAPEAITIYVGTPLPPPVEDSSANLYFAYGDVTVLLPGQTTPIPLSGGLQAPLGSVVNATDGGAGVFVEDNGQLQGANFWNGSYKLTQSGDPHTILYLLGRKIPNVRCALHPHSFSGRFASNTGRLAAARRAAPLALLAGRFLRAGKFHEKGKPTRELWGSGHGNFTTVGNGSSASVRGTEWAIFDYPDGTLTVDYTDSVSVHDFHLHKTVVITAGHYYFAALAKRPACPRPH